MGPQTPRGSENRHTDAQQASRWRTDGGVMGTQDRHGARRLPWADPFSKMRLNEAGSDRDAFTIDELNKLLASPVFTEIDRPGPGRGEAAFWLPLLALFSGARRADLASLQVNNVRDVEGVPCFTFEE